MLQRDLATLGLALPEILLPRQGVNLAKWAVVACDQYTAEPEYWEEVARLVGDAPSTLHLVFPEVYLDRPSAADRIAGIHRRMQEYLTAGVLVSAGTGFVYLERRMRRGLLRRGLLAAVDLERYDYRPGARTLIRATEGTVLERIPPRVRIRAGAALEAPHVMLLLNDPDRLVIEPLAERTEDSRELYRTELMLGGGQIRGLMVGESGTRAVAAGLAGLTARARAADDADPMILAVGDGNHSLATAKTVWEDLKRAGAPPDHPARHALVEVVNLHDRGLVFEPIHRVIFGLPDPEPFLAGFRSFCASAGAGCDVTSFATREEAETRVQTWRNEDHAAHFFVSLTRGGACAIAVRRPPHRLEVGTLQAFLDDQAAKNPELRIDYIHGDQVVANLAAQPGNLGFFLPPLAKGELFRTVTETGVLPKKSFSMGEAEEKRFYMECRRIV